MLRPYRELAAVPGLPALLTWSMLGRVHMPGTPLATSFLIAGWTGSYTAAGLVAGAFALGLGVASPLRGRTADRRPANRLLLVTAAGYTAAMAVAGLLPALLPPSWWPLSVLVAALAGLSLPPVAQVSRANFPRLATGPARQAVFTVEASMQELLYIVGPALAATVVAVANAQVALWLCGALGVLGALGFRAALRRTGLDEPEPRGEHAGRTLLADRSMVCALVTSLCVVASLVTVDMVVIAWARDLGDPALAGVLVAVWGVGSTAGGLVVGGMSGEVRFTRRMALLALGVAALVPVLPPVLSPSSAWLIGLVLCVGGMAIAPAIAANNARISDLAPDGRKAEAFGWVSAFSTAGSATVLPLAGWLLDHVGPAAAAGAAAGAAGLAVLLASRVRVPRRELAGSVA
ncbi:MFS transporter [Saccharothrix australiensis]|uniref:Putative MFS family arabinose efflux permease n=1 Tax=Saccharothrix australiensis TaxID=2072 RepID=A0A495WCU8_9PSEU|nr:MFS transporter [Saccharothrix australiensis]RKT57638.1 putative MFS family arabinose efflux permease [Saccharothrix australiensis]